jgi:AcrR family transcriptional regulator
VLGVAKRTESEKAPAKKPTRQRILEACVECFAKHGFAGTSTRTLAAAADVNIATLAYHFKDKDGLYKAAVDAIYEQLSHVAPELDLSPDLSVEDRLSAAVRFGYRFSREHKTATRLLIRHVIEHGHLPDQVHDEWLEQLLDRAEIAWTLLGLAPDPQWKLKLLTFNHLIARFSITEPRDLAPFLDADDPHQAIEDHLVQIAVKLLVD